MKCSFLPVQEPSPLLLQASNFAGDGGDSNISASLDIDESSQMSGNTDVYDGSESRDTATPTSTRKRGPQGKVGRSQAKRVDRFTGFSEISTFYSFRLIDIGILYVLSKWTSTFRVELEIVDQGIKNSFFAFVEL